MTYWKSSCCLLQMLWHLQLATTYQISQTIWSESASFSENMCYCSVFHFRHFIVWQKKWQHSIIFQSPNNIYKPSSNCISCFLYANSSTYFPAKHLNIFQYFTGFRWVNFSIKFTCLYFKMKFPNSGFILKIICLQIKLLSTNLSKKKKKAILEGSQELVAKESPIRNHLPWLILAIYIAVLCPLPLKFCVT